MFNRIQKLLSAEYSSFHEDILVESPFAQLSKRMKGIRSVQIALTEKNLIIASDIFLHELLMVNRVDAEVETLELLQIIPLKFLKLKLTRKGLHDKFFMKIIYKRNPHRAWKVFEFGGHFMKHFYWDVWSERLCEMREKEQIFMNSSMENLKVLKGFETKKYSGNLSQTSVSLSVEEESQSELKINAEMENSDKIELKSKEKSEKKQEIDGNQKKIE